MPRRTLALLLLSLPSLGSLVVISACGDDDSSSCPLDGGTFADVAASPDTGADALPGPNDAQATTDAPTPAIVQLATGNQHSCALVSGGSVYCWGENRFGQLGLGPKSGIQAGSSVPSRIHGLPTNITAITAGGLHTCALTSDGVVYCWGYNFYGQVGNGNQADGGALPDTATPTPVSGLANVSAISGGAYHTCALLGGGTVSCWGAGGYGQLGGGPFTGAAPPDSHLPAAVVGLPPNVVAVAAEYDNTCTLISGGTVQCFGLGRIGGLGYTYSDGGLPNMTATPLGVQSLAPGVTAISSRGDFTCALAADGTVPCWGYNLYGQLGAVPQISPVPTPIPGVPTGITQLSAGKWHVCALAAGAVTCWGRNESGQVGTATDGGPASNVLPPALVNGLPSGIMHLAAGLAHTCAATADKVFCWGNNKNGELGNGPAGGGNIVDAGSNPVPSSATPVQVTAVPGFQKP